MFRSIRSRMMLSGFTVLAIGVALLVFTFVSAYGFLGESLSIIASADLAETFGGTLPPLIATCIRVMYLGVMGWVGSLITVRGVTVVTNARDGEKLVAPKKVEAEQKVPSKKEVKAEKPQKEVAKREEKRLEPRIAPEPEVVVVPSEQIELKEQQPESKTTSEPEFVVIPPEQIEQEQQQSEETQREQRQPDNV